MLCWFCTVAFATIYENKINKKTLNYKINFEDKYFWRQTCHLNNHSYTCSSSDIALNPLKTNLCRFLHRDVVPAERFIYLPGSDRRAFFNTFRSPDYIRGIDLGYVHFADMSRWRHPDGDNAFFLDHVVLTNFPCEQTHFHHIDLDFCGETPSQPSTKAASEAMPPRPPL